MSIAPSRTAPCHHGSAAGHQAGARRPAGERARPHAAVPAPRRASQHGEGFQHMALLYLTEQEYLVEVAEFVRAGLARGDAVLVAVPGFRAGPLRRALGEDAARVAFEEMSDVGRNPHRILSAVHDFVGRHRGRGVSAVGEPSWPSRSSPEVVEVACHEGLANLALRGSRVHALCPYDVAALPAAVTKLAAQTHPLLSGPDGLVASAAYLGPAEVPPVCLEPLPAPPPTAVELRYRTDPRPVRDLAGARATAAGLSRGRVADLALAVGELAANTVRHSGHGGVLRVWQTGAELVCEVSDDGWITNPLAGRRRPAGADARGHGLWLVHQVCDLVETRTGPAGTTVRLHMRTPSRSWGARALLELTRG